MDGQVTVDPEVLVAALIGAGWEVIVRVPDKYVRLCGPDDQRTVLVPTNPEMADYTYLLDEIVHGFRRQARDGRRAQRVLDAIGEEANHG